MRYSTAPKKENMFKDMVFLSFLTKHGDILVKQ